MVLILHVGDIRSRQCPAGTQSACATKAVIDRVAWVAGNDVESGPRIDLATSLTPDEAISATHLEWNVLTALPVRLGDAWKIDPRFQGIGDAPVWVIRGIPEQSAAPEDPSRSVDVRLVNDATSTVIFAGELAPGNDYSPARLLIQASSGDTSRGSAMAVFYRVEDASGTGLVEAHMGGTMQTADDTTIHAIAAPVLLNPGSYLVRVWQSPSGGTGHAHFNECTKQLDVTASADVQVEASFAGQGDCEFVTPTFVNDYSR